MSISAKEFHMAAIDKIYGTKAQYDEFKKWCSENKPEALEFFYEWYDEYNEKENYAMTNFPERIDRWLLKNCKIDWVVAYIKDQYGK